MYPAECIKKHSVGAISPSCDVDIKCLLWHKNTSYVVHYFRTEVMHYAKVSTSIKVFMIHR